MPSPPRSPENRRRRIWNWRCCGGGGASRGWCGGNSGRVRGNEQKGFWVGRVVAGGEEEEGEPESWAFHEEPGEGRGHGGACRKGLGGTGGR
ncbi:hypothetical protein ACFX14_009942 [Malus domestica]